MSQKQGASLAHVPFCQNRFEIQRYFYQGSMPVQFSLPPYPVLLKRLFGCALGYLFFVTDFWLYQKAIKGYLLGSRSSRSRRSLQVFGKHGELGTERVF